MAAAIDVSSVNYDRMKEVKEFDESKVGVKGLSDSGITNIPRIFIHPLETLSDLKTPLYSTSQIPVIDFSGVNSSIDRPKIVEKIRETANDWGFFQVIGHGIPLKTIEATTAAIKAFHEQPLEEKKKYYKRDELGGFSYTSNNDLYRSKAATWHDYIQVYVEATPEDQIPEIFRKEVLEWSKQASKVMEMVLEVLSEGLGVERSRLKDLGLMEVNLLVGTCYPYCPQPELTLGLSHHTDSGAITLLLPNQVPGLQVKHGGQWVDVKPLHGAFIINIGDCLQIISNGEYNSVQHRVLANSSKEARISVVEFFNFHKKPGIELGPLPELLSPEKPARYRSFTSEEFFSNFYDKGLDSKSLIDKCKL